MKRTITISACVIAILYLSYFMFTGLLTNSSVYIEDYSLNQEGTEMTIDIGVISSMGYIRDVMPVNKENGRLYLNAYSAFGGLNGKVGAKDSYTIPIDTDVTSITFSLDPENGSDLLVKDEKGNWKRPAEMKNE